MKILRGGELYQTVWYRNRKPCATLGVPGGWAYKNSRPYIFEVRVTLGDRRIQTIQIDKVHQYSTHDSVLIVICDLHLRRHLGSAPELLTGSVTMSSAVMFFLTSWRPDESVISQSTLLYFCPGTWHAHYKKNKYLFFQDIDMTL